MEILTEKDFKRIPRLRWKTSEDGSPIAVTIKKKLRKDFLCFWGPGQLAIYYTRETRRQATAALEFWLKKCPQARTLSGDFDGFVFFDPEVGVPPEFIKHARKTPAVA